MPFNVEVEISGSRRVPVTTKGETFTSGKIHESEVFILKDPRKYLPESEIVTHDVEVVLYDEGFTGTHHKAFFSIGRNSQYTTRQPDEMSKTQGYVLESSWQGVKVRAIATLTE